ncbi:uncharacterized protein LOC130985346 [Salvia miltiorrhiza]|uniref:uncharacterized protein LOC130985345 n=1 Tax=Salvia miltiorrhiza TaxID=226208 RepID=UPI0025ABAA2A|nr:uncharacterized protein LOC130985345 [Salvia miltiorrhiza]XP_057764267.1 uncharacterized protein LOC130985346 [Salvia miltiorrhiza]
MVKLNLELLVWKITNITLERPIMKSRLSFCQRDSSIYPVTSAQLSPHVSTHLNHRGSVHLRGAFDQIVQPLYDEYLNRTHNERHIPLFRVELQVQLVLLQQAPLQRDPPEDY